MRPSHFPTLFPQRIMFPCAQRAASFIPQLDCPVSFRVRLEMRCKAPRDSSAQSPLQCKAGHDCVLQTLNSILVGRFVQV